MKTFEVEFPDEPAPGSVVLTERGVAYQRPPKPTGPFSGLGGVPQLWWPAERPDDENGASVQTWRGLCVTGRLRLIYDASEEAAG